MKTVNDIGERGLIKIISEILGGLGNEILQGEDDAVAINLPDPSIMVINNDMLVSTTDIPPQMSLFQAARKAVIMTVSDVLVKAAIPKWAVIALGIPKNLPIDGIDGFRELISGLKEGFLEYDVKYLGGDLNETNEIIISCTIFGEAPYGVISRSGAKPGNKIICTGDLGNTGCGFSILLDNKQPEKLSEDLRIQFINSVLKPYTPIKYGQILQEKKWVSASCDSSDGILITLYEICKASDVGAILEWDSLPLASGVVDFSIQTNQNLIDLVLNAGEEFIHLFTIPKSKITSVKSYFNRLGLTCNVIGTITEEKTLVLNKNNDKIILDSRSGYQHFYKKKR